MHTRRVFVAAAVAAAAALVLLAWLPVQQASVAAATGAVAPGSARHADQPPPAGRANAGAGDAQVASWFTSAPTPAPTPAAALVVPLALTVTRTLAVGETGELTLAVAPGVAIGTISFNVQFDANVLQARTGAEGDWAANAGVVGRFVADLADTADRVQVRSALPARRLAASGGTVATIQFQAVAPGSTSVVVGDVTVLDLAGNSVRFALAAGNVQVVAEPAPALPRLQSRRQPAPVLAAPTPDQDSVGD